MQDFPVFARQAGFDPAEWQEALTVWRARSQNVAAGECFVRQGDKVRCFYVVLSGVMQVMMDDYWGNRSVLSLVEAGHIFGAAYAFDGVPAYPIAAMAVEPCVLLCIPLDGYWASATARPDLFAKAQQGFLRALAHRSVSLLHTIEQVKQRSLRQKILAYLSYESARAGSTRFRVPLSRQALADYLAADRASLCRELSKLRDEGLLDYRKGQFVLYLPRES